LGAADAKADAQFKYDSATRNLSWKTSAGASDMMTLDASGNLGIGETSIASKLAVTASLPYATVTGSGSGQYGFQLKAGGSDSAGTLVGGLTYNSATGENRILGPQSYNFLTMYAGGSERARIDSSGNLGLGVTPSAWGSGFSVLQLESKAALIGNNGATYLGNNWYSNAGSKYIGTGLAALYAQSVGAHTWYNAPSGTAGNAITFTQAMTLDASGNLFVGATALTSNLNYFAYSPGNTFADFGHITGVASTTSYARFLYAGGVIGSITQNGTTSVNFNGYIVNPSDRKLKTNIVDAPSSLLLIDKIQIRSFDWIAEEKNQSYGVIAQELETVFPEAVNAPINEDGFYGVDYTKLVPMLVKAIQEQQALITTLTARITALEGA